MERTFFDQAQDLLEGFVIDFEGILETRVLRHGVRILFGDATRERYEAQVIRLDGKIILEVGFDAERPIVCEN